MHNRQKYLENKRKDYQTFIYTLFILSIYFYLGFVIEVYDMPKTDHTDILAVFSLTSISALTFFLMRYNQIQRELREDDHA